MPLASDYRIDAPYFVPAQWTPRAGKSLANDSSGDMRFNIHNHNTRNTICQKPEF
jgi:hypothetical protein